MLQAAITGTVYNYAGSSCLGTPQISSFVSGQCSSRTGSAMVTCFATGSWSVLLYGSSTSCSGASIGTYVGYGTQCVDANGQCKQLSYSIVYVVIM